MAQINERSAALLEPPLSVDAAVRAALSRPSEIKSFVNEDDMEGPRARGPKDAFAAVPAP